MRTSLTFMLLVISGCATEVEQGAASGNTPDVAVDAEALLPPPGTVIPFRIQASQIGEPESSGDLLYQLACTFENGGDLAVRNNSTSGQGLTFTVDGRLYVDNDGNEEYVGRSWGTQMLDPGDELGFSIPRPEDRDLQVTRFEGEIRVY